MNPSRVVEKPCKFCEELFRLPMCRVIRDHFCSSDCSKLYRENKKNARAKICLICGSPFIPRQYQLKAGGGKYCGKKCRGIGFSSIPRTPEWREKISRSQRGRPGKVGPDNPRWKGGHEYCYRQRLADGRIKRNVATYRLRHPEKVREWEQNRGALKTGRLPKGTVSNLLALQKNRCAACKKQLCGKYHVDHVVPLSRGGTHSKGNVQLLCPACNVRKSAKMPERFMREMGFLL